MSHEGKLQRGALWYSKRDIEGNLPEEITKDPNKMKDINYFLENKKKEEAKGKETKSKEKK